MKAILNTGKIFRLKEVRWAAQPELSSQFKVKESGWEVTLINDSKVVAWPFYK